MGAPNGRLPQATSSSSQRSSEVRHKKLPRLHLDMVASHTFGNLRHELAQDEEEFVPPTYTEQLLRQLENTNQGSKYIDAYFKEMKNALR